MTTVSSERERIAATDIETMRVLVNGLALRLGGGGSFLVNQVAALAKVRGLALTVLATGAVAEMLRAACGPAVVVRERRERGAASRFVYEQCVLPWCALHYDVVYQPGGFALFASPRAQVVTNHNPHLFGTPARAFWRGRFPPRIALERLVGRASVRRAEAFVTLSEAFRMTVEEDLGARENVFVLRSAVPMFPSPSIDWPAEGMPVRPYVLTVAHDYVHKDWDGLVKVFCEHRDLPALVIVGAPRSPARARALERFATSSVGSDRVTLVGPVGDRTRLAQLYRGASCFVAHSFLEAGPLTPGEAILHELRVVASDIPAHREACDGRALFYDPADGEQLAATIRSALRDPRPASSPASLRSWTWADNARELATILRSAAAGTPRRWAMRP